MGIQLAKVVNYIIIVLHIVLLVIKWLIALAMILVIVASQKQLMIFEIIVNTLMKKQSLIT